MCEYRTAEDEVEISILKRKMRYRCRRSKVNSRREVFNTPAYVLRAHVYAPQLGVRGDFRKVPYHPAGSAAEFQNPLRDSDKKPLLLKYSDHICDVTLPTRNVGLSIRTVSKPQSYRRNG